MLRQTVSILFLTAICLFLQPITAVVNSGENVKKIEETTSEPSEDDSESVRNSVTDSIADSSDTVNRREAPNLAYGVPSLSLPPPPSVPAKFDSYLPPPSGDVVSLPVPIYGVPNSPSVQSVVYPTPPPDIPPPLPPLQSISVAPLPIYSLPNLGQTYGVPTSSHVPKDTYGPPPPLSGKYGVPSFSTNFNQKSVYGPPKITSGLSNKPFKFYNKYPSKQFGFKSPPKPVYGPPISYNKFKFNKNNQFYSGLNTNSFSSNSYSLPKVYKGLSNLNYQYGVPIKPSILSIQYGVPNGLSTNYGPPEKFSTISTAAYGPPQPSPNPKPPHPGIPAPPTPPDIKYDGWQPIPGLISKPPIKETGGYALVSHNTGYSDLTPPIIGGSYNSIPPSPTYGVPQLPPPPTPTYGVPHPPPPPPPTYGAPQAPPSLPPVSTTLHLEAGHSNSHSSNFGHGGKTVIDSYSAPLGTVTGSGGVVATAAQHAQHESTATHTNSQNNVNYITYPTTSQHSGYESDVQSIKSIGHEIYPQISTSYGLPQASTLTSSQIASTHQNSINLDHNSVESSIGLVPPSGVYGAAPTSSYGTPLYSHINSGSGNFESLNYQNDGQDISSFSYLPATSIKLTPSSAYGVPNSGSEGGAGSAVSYQSFVQGSASAGLNQQHSELHINGASALPLTNTGSYGGVSSISSSDDSTNIGLDYSHPPVTIDFTQKSNPADCISNKQLPVPSLAYGVPSADSYSSSLSSLTTNIATSHTSQSVVPQPVYGPPQSEYGAPDLLHSASIKTESKANSIQSEIAEEENREEESQGKTYGQSVAESFGPNTELVQSQSIDLNNIPLQGNLGSYTLQIQSSDGSTNKLPHNQILNEGLLQSILQAIEQPGQKSNDKYPIILQPNIRVDNLNTSVYDGAQSQSSEIKEIIVEAPRNNQQEDEVGLEAKVDEKNKEEKETSSNGDSDDNDDDEEMLQLLDSSNIALYYRTSDGVKEVKTIKEPDDNRINNSNSN